MPILSKKKIKELNQRLDRLESNKERIYYEVFLERRKDSPISQMTPQQREKIRNFFDELLRRAEKIQEDQKKADSIEEQILDNNTECCSDDKQK